MLTRRHHLLFLAPVVLLLIPFLLWPALFGLFASFTNYVPFQHIDLRFVGLDNYSQVLSDPDFQIAIRNVGIFTVVSVLIEMIGGVGIAYALRRPFRGRSLVRFILLLPWLISPVANGVMWHFLLNTTTGLVNFLPSVLGLAPLPSLIGPGLALFSIIAIDAWRKIPLVSFLVLPGMLAIPAAQWDQAEVEGLATWTRLRHIVVPRLRLLLLTIALLLVGDALGTSESILILTGGGPSSETMTPGLYSFRRAIYVYDWKIGSASAWLITLAVIGVGIYYLFLSRSKATQ